jgi:hypothetical protein
VDPADYAGSGSRPFDAAITCDAREVDDLNTIGRNRNARNSLCRLASHFGRVVGNGDRQIAAGGVREIALNQRGCNRLDERRGRGDLSQSVLPMTRRRRVVNGSCQNGCSGRNEEDVGLRKREALRYRIVDVKRLTGRNTLRKDLHRRPFGRPRTASDQSSFRNRTSETAARAHLWRRAC